MEEVHRRVPSTVRRANVTGEKKEAMLRAIAFSKARKAGAKVPRKRSKHKSRHINHRKRSGHRKK